VEDGGDGGVVRAGGADPAGSVLPAGAPGGPWPNTVRCGCRSSGAGAVAGQSAANSVRCAGGRRTEPGFLAAGRDVLRLRADHKRAGGHAHDRAVLRPRAGRGHGGEPAGDDGPVRPSGDDGVGLADRPDRSAQAAVRLLRPARAVADLPALCRLHVLWAVVLRGVLWAGLDRDGAADARAGEPGVRRTACTGDLRLDLGQSSAGRSNRRGTGGRIADGERVVPRRVRDGGSRGAGGGIGVALHRDRPAADAFGDRLPRFAGKNLPGARKCGFRRT